MGRTTELAVETLLGDDYNGTIDLGQFIESATVIVSRVAICATSRGKTLTATELELIERWLAAHAYAQNDQTYSKKQTEKSSGSFHGQTGKGIESSRYGQMALTLDHSGCLAAIASGTDRKTARLDWGGTPWSDQTPYYQRD